MTFMEKFARRYARRTTRSGVPVLITNGDPLLLEAFKELGWDDPHEDVVPETASRGVKATVEDPERATAKPPKGR